MFLFPDDREENRTERPLNEEDEEGQHRHKDEDEGSASPSSSSAKSMEEDGAPTLVPKTSLNKIFSGSEMARVKVSPRAKGHMVGSPVHGHKRRRRSNGSSLDEDQQRDLNEEDDER